MRRSAANVARPPSGPRPSHSSSNIRGYLSAARSAQNTVPPSPSPSVQSTSARGRATSPTLKRKDRDFDPPNDDDYETNITVVVRCRGRNAREIAENSGVVLSTPGGLRGREVVMNTGTATGGNRTYTFDRVLPPESDQSMVYDDVVQPILTEVGLFYSLHSHLDGGVSRANTWAHIRCFRGTIVLYLHMARPELARRTQ